MAAAHVSAAENPSASGRYILARPEMVWFGLTPEYIRGHLGIRFAVDNHRSVEELGVSYRPVEETVLDHYESWWHAKHRRPSR